MTKEELKDKCAERAKIFQETMESCKSSNPVDCIEWFADKIIELKKACDETQTLLDKQIEATYKVVEKLNEAKEIIKDFVGWANWQGNSKCPSFKSIQDKAERFLKGE